jgi:hypothetical protein
MRLIGFYYIYIICEIRIIRILILYNELSIKIIFIYYF